MGEKYSCFKDQRPFFKSREMHEKTEKRCGEFMKNVDDGEDDDSNPFAYVLLIGAVHGLAPNHNGRLD